MQLKLDERIKMLRRMYQECGTAKFRADSPELSDSDIEDFAQSCLENLNRLQQLRVKQLGSYLPCRDGKIWYLDVDRNKWFEYWAPPTGQLMVGI